VDGITRRQALGLGAATLVGGAVGGCGLAGGRQLVATGVPLGSLSDVTWTPSGSCGSPAAYLRRNPITGRAEALSTRCPGAGCPVRYEAQTERFVCSCHGRIFDDSGNPIAGPPTQPLTKLGTALRGGEVYLVGVTRACG
jgi:nitrite reductase/ring-hydroxylating ferredoxin subunit